MEAGHARIKKIQGFNFQQQSRYNSELYGNIILVSAYQLLSTYREYPLSMSFLFLVLVHLVDRRRLLVLAFFPLEGLLAGTLCLISCDDDELAGPFKWDENAKEPDLEHWWCLKRRN